MIKKYLSLILLIRGLNIVNAKYKAVQQRKGSLWCVFEVAMNAIIDRNLSYQNAIDFATRLNASKAVINIKIKR